MHREVLTPATAVVLKKISASLWVKKFYLAGGTALALQYGHRQSVDLDWFCSQPFRTEPIIAALAKLGSFALVNETENTVDGILDGVKVSFFSYPYKLLRAPKKFECTALASVADIACMKLNAIAGRNARKDFVDLYFILDREGWTLGDVLHLCDRKYGAARRDVYHVLRALTFFDEADAQPEVEIKPPVRWSVVKKFFTGAAKQMAA